MAKVFVIMKNSDFTEGRGPMDIHKIKKKEQDAVDYVMSQEGIYGSEQREYSRSSYSEVRHFNGYDIAPMDVE